MIGPQMFQMSSNPTVSGQIPLVNQNSFQLPSIIPQLNGLGNPNSTTFQTLPLDHSQNYQSNQSQMRDHFISLGINFTPVPWNQSYGMERVWMAEFRRIFSQFYSDLWAIQPVFNKPIGPHKFHMFVDAAKVRFCCENCSHSWTSMKGRIIFWFNLIPPNFKSGFVGIRLFGQRCESCKQDSFEQPMWYPEEVTKVLMNLYNRVGSIYYGFEKTKFEKHRRIGKPRTPHNKFLCQACTEGICLRGLKTSRTESNSRSSLTVSQIQNQSSQKSTSSSTEPNSEDDSSKNDDKNEIKILPTGSEENENREQNLPIFSDSDDSGILDNDHSPQTDSDCKINTLKQRTLKLRTTSEQQKASSKLSLLVPKSEMTIEKNDKNDDKNEIIQNNQQKQNLSIVNDVNVQ